MLGLFKWVYFGRFLEAFVYLNNQSFFASKGHERGEPQAANGEEAANAAEAARAAEAEAAEALDRLKVLYS